MGPNPVPMRWYYKIYGAYLQFFTRFHPRNDRPGVSALLLMSFVAFINLTCITFIVLTLAPGPGISRIRRWEVILAVGIVLLLHGFLLGKFKPFSEHPPVPETVNPARAKAIATLYHILTALLFIATLVVINVV